MDTQKQSVFVTNDALKTYKERKPNWENVPEVMRFLIPFAEKYGSLQYDGVIWDFFTECSKEEKLAILKMEARITESVVEAWEKFSKSFPMIDHEESSLFYFLGYFLALGHTCGHLPELPEDLV